MKQQNEQDQLSLLAFGGVQLTGSVGDVFVHTPIKDRDGDIIGYSLSMQKNKDIAKNFGLSTKKDKALIEEKRLEISDKAFSMVKGEIASLDSKDGWTLRKVARRTVGGELQITTVLRQIARSKKQMSDEEIAKMWSESTGQQMTAEMVRTMREKQLQELENQEEKTHDVPATSSAA